MSKRSNTYSWRDWPSLTKAVMTFYQEGGRGYNRDERTANQGSGDTVYTYHVDDKNGKFNYVEFCTKVNDGRDYVNWCRVTGTVEFFEEFNTIALEERNFPGNTERKAGTIKKFNI
jgi:hypothetical protein